MSELRFDGEAAVVTGAGGGIGRAAALELARRGARVIVNDIQREESEGAQGLSAAAVVDDIVAGGGEAAPCLTSVATRDGGKEVVDAALERWGRLDVVVAAAGNMRPNLVEDTPPGDFADLHDVHFGGLLNVVLPAAGPLSEVGGGRVVVVSSHAALFGGVGHGNYAAAKGAQLGLFRVLAYELAECGIRMNAVLPRALRTRLALEASDTAIWTARDDIPEFDPDFLADLLPESVASLITALAHAEVPWNSQLFVAQGRFFSRLWFSLGRGWVSEGAPSAEDVATHWSEIATNDHGEEVEGDTVDFNARVQQLVRALEAERRVGDAGPE